MSKILTLKSLEKDKQIIEKNMHVLQQQLNQAQAQLFRLDGALGYIKDNIKQVNGSKEADATDGGEE